MIAMKDYDIFEDEIFDRRETVKHNRKLPLGLVGQVLLCLSMFILYGFTLTTNTLFICLLIINVIYFRTGVMRNGEYLSTWPVYLLLGGAVSLTTLCKLYNPDAHVYTNVDHHFLKLTGFTSAGDSISLLDVRNGTSENPPLWDEKTLGTYAILDKSGDSIVLRYRLCQPIYKKIRTMDSLINICNLPVFNETFTLHLKSNVGLQVTVKDYTDSDAPLIDGMDNTAKIPKYSSRVQVKFMKKGMEPIIKYGGFTKFITRSLPLSDLIDDIPVPEGYDVEWETLSGITLLRPVGGDKLENIQPGKFHISFTTPILDILSGITCNDKNYRAKELFIDGLISIPVGTTIRIGSGLLATPYLKPELVDGNMAIKLDVPLRQKLPYEKDSLGHTQSVLVTSSLQSMAASTTTGSIYYPVFPDLDENKQFKFALEYLPEKSVVPLKCKMQLLGDEQLDRSVYSEDGNVKLLKGGDRLRLNNKHRYLSPDFEFVNLRETAPFSTTKGYWLVFAVLLGAGLSFLASRGKVETRGETCLWLGLLALITCRAFIAWRTTVFPPLSGFSEDAFKLYGSDKYTFWAAFVLIFVVITLPLVIYKLFHLTGEKENSYRKYKLLLLSVLLILLLGFVVSTQFDTSLLLYIYFPVLFFIVSEGIYLYRTACDKKNGDSCFMPIRYVCMLLSIIILLVMDSSFGIKFLIFLILYNTLDYLFLSIFNFANYCLKQYWFPVLSTLLMLLIGFMVSKLFNTSRFFYIYFPVLSFIISEWFYLRCTASDKKNDDYRFSLIRYLCMLLSIIIPLVKDSGFGIVFLMFLFLYNALDCHYFLKFTGTQGEKEKKGITFRIKQMKLYSMFALIGVFLLLMLCGPRMVSLLYRNFYLIGVILLGVTAYICYTYYKISVINNYKRSWAYIPIVLIAIFLLFFLGFGLYALEKHRHLLYRSEIHIKSVDEILLENEVDSRDMERLFQASQNQWYLGFYMDGRSTEKLKPFDRPYDLRSHFNKGITWDTQKTDAILSRYVIGEHSVWLAYSLIFLFVLLFVSVFVSAKGKSKYTLLGCGAVLLLLCQVVFITMAVTNRFIFFGQDYPLLSQHSLLTVCLTYTLIFIAMLSSAELVTENTDRKSYNKPDWKSVTLLAVIFALVIGTDPSVSESNKNFNVAQAIQQAKNELRGVNEMFLEYQESHMDELAQKQIVRHFLTNKELETNSGKHILIKPKELQSDYSDLMQLFDKEMSVGDTLTSRAKSLGSSISPFTASLYKTYRDKLSKHNCSTDIIHLKATSSGKLQFNINNGYYMLTTPESNQKTWTGSVLPSESSAQSTNLILRGENKNKPIPLEKGAERLDKRLGLGYDYPMFLCKLDNHWVPGGKDVLVVRSISAPISVKNGAKTYKLSKKGGAARYLVLKDDDYIEIHKDENVGNRRGEIYMRGGVGKYFARNMLVNGKRMMVYPLGEKFFYPYHISQMGKGALSGEDIDLRKKDIHLTLSYTLSDELYKYLDEYKGGISEPDARGLVVVDGNGHIKAMVTTKNPYRNTGYRKIDPNDTEYIGRLIDVYYLNGDNIAEERTFGDINLSYLNPGPGSSIKPITFDAVASQVCYDWRKLCLYVNLNEQNMEKYKKYPADVNRIRNKNGYYTNIYRPFPSLYNDEIGKDGYTDIQRYMEKSSNYFNSLMVFFGFYQSEFLGNELAKVRLGRNSELFKPYRANEKFNFPAFTLRVGEGTKKFVFRQWVTLDGMARHDDGVLSTGYQQNFGLLSDYPQNLDENISWETVDLFRDNQTFDIKSLLRTYSFAYPRISYLPDRDRTSKMGARNAILNTTLGASPFQVTPLKMAEMFGRLISQNRNFKLTLNPNYNSDYEAFELDKRYSGNVGLYYNILGNYLLDGMRMVPIGEGTARALGKIVTQINTMGYQVYAKTGTISSRKEGKDSQLLAVIISKNKMHGCSDLSNFDKLFRNNRFYVMYFVSSNGLHNYQAISKALMSVVDNTEFRKYMENK